MHRAYPGRNRKKRNGPVLTNMGLNGISNLSSDIPPRRRFGNAVLRARAALWRLVGRPGHAAGMLRVGLTDTPRDGRLHRALLLTLIDEKRRFGKRERAIGNIYFLERFVDLRKLFAVYEKGKLNVMVVMDQSHYVKLFYQLFPDDVILPLPQINIRPPAPVDAQERRLQIIEMRSWRSCYRQAFAGIPRTMKGFFTSYEGRPNLMIIAEVLRARRHDVFFVDENTEIKRSEQEEIRAAVNEAARPKDNKFLESLGHAFGLEIIENSYSRHSPVREYVPAETELWPRPIFVDFPPWEKITRQFPLTFKFEPKNAVLLVDLPLTNHKGFDVPKTKRNTEAVIRAVLEKGYAVHVKPHPLGGEETTLTGTALETAVHVLPPEVPVEYFLYHYDRILFFSSKTTCLDLPGEKYCLRHLLAVTDEEGEKRVATFDNTLAEAKDIKAWITAKNYTEVIGAWPTATPLPTSAAIR